METILVILLLYIISVSIYTIIIRNDATHKYVQHIKILPIVKEGSIGMGVAFAIIGIIYGIISGIMYITA